MTCLRSLLALSLALVVFVTHALADFSGKVVGVSDGDTITVLRERTPVKVRLYGIDCPESGQDFGSRAKLFTSELVFGKVVTVIPHDTDRYGRTVADVVLPDGRSLNQELVKAGLAWWYRKYAPNIGTLSQLEREARDAQRGLWSQPNPVPPWEWRDQKRALPAELSGKFIANSRSHVYHKPGCRNAGTISASNRVVFESAEAAERAGYRPGRDCHPR
jgi:endonuclease YncB( thermonuclease family)